MQKKIDSDEKEAKNPGVEAYWHLTLLILLREAKQKRWGKQGKSHKVLELAMGFNDKVTEKYCEKPTGKNPQKRRSITLPMDQPR